MDDLIEARFRLQWPAFTLDVDLRVPGGGVTALFGHSGSGKTTLLRCIAGLERGATGRLQVRGQPWQDSERSVFMPTHKRPLGYVFQEASLFPHLTVRGNLDFGRRRSRATRHLSLDHAIELLGIAHLLERMPARLSGGERQRVAIARALATSPSLLLMDEPLASLDAQRKTEVLPYLERLCAERELPVLYVSHSPDEVARLAEHVVLLEGGRVIASGTLTETLARLDLPIAFAEDAGVVVEAELAEHDERYHLSRLAFDGGSVFVARRDQRPGSRLRFRIYARDVSLALSRAEGTSINNLLPATVREVVAADNPAHVLVRLDAARTPLLARITRRSFDQLELGAGRNVWAQIKSVALLD